MAFIPINDTSGNLNIGESNKNLTLRGSTPFVPANAYQSYSTTVTMSANTYATVVPQNFIVPNIPVLVVGRVDLPTTPWFHVYAFCWTNVSQNGTSDAGANVIAFNHTSYGYVIVRGTSASGHIPAPLQIAVGSVSFTNLTASVTHRFFRIGV